MSGCAKAGTARERAYLDAAETLFAEPGDQLARHAAFAEAMRRISEQHPDDVDAAVLYVFALIGLVPVGVYDDPRLERAGAAAERAFALNPAAPRARRMPSSMRTTIASGPPVRSRRPGPTRKSRWRRAMRGICPRTCSSSWECGTKPWPRMKPRGTPRSSHAKQRGLTASQRDYHPLSWLVYEYIQQGRFDRSRDALKPLEEALAADPKPWMKNELATWRAYYIVGSERWTEAANRRRSTTPTSCSRWDMPRRKHTILPRRAPRWT